MAAESRILMRSGARATNHLQENVLRYLVGFLTVVGILGFAWVFSLPDKAECLASGRVVDPTERHCESGQGYEQLEEHALFHSREVVLGGLVILAGAYAVRRYISRHSSASATAA